MHKVTAKMKKGGEGKSKSQKKWNRRVKSEKKKNNRNHKKWYFPNGSQKVVANGRNDPNHRKKQTNLQETQVQGDLWIRQKRNKRH